jgi:hypothetical protein
MARTHRIEKLFAHDPAMGVIYHLQSSPDGSSVAYLACHDPGGAYAEPKVVWNGRVMAATESLIGAGDLKPDLSPDGRHLAICRFDPARRRWTVDLDGQERWRTDLDTVHYTGWLDAGRFAWEGWLHGEDGDIDGPLRYFVDGEEVTGKLKLQGVTDTRRSGLCVTDMERAVEYTVWEDGERSPEVRIIQTEECGWLREDDWKVTGRIHRRDRDGRPEVRHDREKRLCQVACRGLLSPTAFHEIESHGGLRTFTTAAATDRFSYVGVRYGGWATRLGSWIGKRLERESEREEGNGGKMTKRGWLMAMLFNPYFGIGHRAMEGSKRYFPVNLHCFMEDGEWMLAESVWKKGYRYASVELLTPSGELAVSASGRRGTRIVIDEAEGPEFETIWNVRHLAEGDRISYVGLKDGDLYRVSAEK